METRRDAGKTLRYSNTVIIRISVETRGLYRQSPNQSLRGLVVSDYRRTLLTLIYQPVRCGPMSCISDDPLVDELGRVNALMYAFLPELNLHVANIEIMMFTKTGSLRCQD